MSMRCSSAGLDGLSCQAGSGTYTLVRTEHAICRVAGGDGVCILNCSGFMKVVTSRPRAASSVLSLTPSATLAGAIVKSRMR